MEVILRSLQGPRVKDILTIVVTLGVFAVFASIYFALKPTVVIPPPGWNNPCPDRWSYDPDTQYCTPQYPTQCKSFLTTSYQDASQKCDIAKSCGTTWKGQC